MSSTTLQLFQNLRGGDLWIVLFSSRCMGLGSWHSLENSPERLRSQDHKSTPREAGEPSAKVTKVGQGETRRSLFPQRLIHQAPTAPWAQSSDLDLQKRDLSFHL